MKVNFGPYPHHWSTRRAEWLYYQLRYCKYEFEIDNKDRFDLAVEWFFEKWQDYVCNTFNKYVGFRRKRREIVKIDGYDCWNLDNTLAMIIAPSLVKLREIKHGSPCVSDEDVPEHLHSGKTVDEQFGPDVDDNHHNRWQYVLDEMIFAFEQAAKGDYGEYAFHHNSDQLAMSFKPSEFNGLSSIEFDYQKDPARPKYYVDQEGKEAHMARVRNGFRLFGKYYQSLWD